MQKIAHMGFIAGFTKKALDQQMWSVAIPTLLGAGIGGTAGYIFSPEDRRIKNIILGMLGGGGLGVGAGLYAANKNLKSYERGKKIGYDEGHRSGISESYDGNFANDKNPYDTGS